MYYALNAIVTVSSNFSGHRTLSFTTYRSSFQGLQVVGPAWADELADFGRLGWLLTEFKRAKQLAF